MIELAQAKETVRKGKNSHPFLGELAYMKGDIRKQVVVNAEEVIKVSIYDPVFSSTDNEHGWLDKNGWESRKAYVLAGDGMLYEAYLKIAKARDGRNILYTVNVDVKKGITVDQDATSKKAAVLAVTPSDKEDTTYSYKSQERDSDGTRYSYDYLIQKDAMEIKPLADVSQSEVNAYLKDHNLFSKEMRKISSQYGNPKNTSTSTYLHCNDLNADVMITREF